jgi:hypothetical protein
MWRHRYCDVSVGRRRSCGFELVRVGELQLGSEAASGSRVFLGGAATSGSPIKALQQASA